MHNGTNDMQWVYNAKLKSPETLEFMRVLGFIYMENHRRFSAINKTGVTVTFPHNGTNGTGVDTVATIPSLTF